MNNQEIYYDADAGTALAHTPATGIVTLQSYAIAQSDTRFGRKLEAKGQRAVAIGYMQARVVNESILCVGAVGATAQAVINAVPVAEEPVRKIMNGLADKVVKEIQTSPSWW